MLYVPHADGSGDASAGDTSTELPSLGPETFTIPLAVLGAFTFFALVEIGIKLYVLRPAPSLNNVGYAVCVCFVRHYA